MYTVYTNNVTVDTLYEKFKYTVPCITKQERLCYKCTCKFTMHSSNLHVHVNKQKSHPQCTCTCSTNNYM